jgi:asparaginyl-tRNA synthetase
MNDNTTLAQEMVAAAPGATRNGSLSTDPKRMAVIKVWDAMFRGARKHKT